MKRETKQVISKFLQANYSDQALCNLLCIAEDGKMDFGNPKMCLLGLTDRGYFYVKTDPSSCYSSAREVELAFLNMGQTFFTWGKSRDQQRSKAMLPLIRAEIARRDKERKTSKTLEYQSTPEILVKIKGGE